MASPRLNHCTFKPSNSFNFSYLSRFLKILIFCRKANSADLRYFELSMMIFLKMLPSRTQTIPSVYPVIVADLGASYSKATSPKASPSLSILIRGLPVYSELIMTWHLPFLRMKYSCPRSPLLIRFLPAENLTSFMLSTIR